VAAWAGLHPKLWTRGRFADATVPPIVRGTVIGVQVSRLPKPAGRLKVLWLWWAGPGAPDLDLSTPSGSVSRPSAGPPRGCARLPRRTGGPGCCWPLPPNSAWPGHWSPTNAYRGNGGLTRIGSPPPASDGGFADCTRPYRWSPERRNPAGQAQGGPRLPSRPSSRHPATRKNGNLVIPNQPTR
jgi:hypothetical protein